MIEGFLDRISGLLDKGLILGALFPLLIVGFILTTSIIAILGWRASLFWLDGLSGSSALALTMLSTIVLFLLALVLRSLRIPILTMWSGAAAPERLKLRQANRRKTIETEIEEATIWEHAGQAIGRINSQKREDKIPDSEHSALLTQIDGLFRSAETVDPRKLRTEADSIVNDLERAFRWYDYERLAIIYKPLRKFVQMREADETLRRQSLQAKLSLEFGPSGIISATRLGNVLLAIDGYPYQRYRMEGGRFWPHLEQVMHGDLLEDIRNQRILLDSTLALATLFALTAGLAIIVGPWIWVGGSWACAAAVWGFAAVVTGSISYGSYLVAIPTAAALSRALRAGCDLYRRDLLFALGLDPPNTLEMEQAAWTELSRLVVYGHAGSLTFRSRPEHTSGQS